MPDPPRMVFLGFGKYARADRIYALEPILGDERGGGRRTRVWIDGVPFQVYALTHSTLALGLFSLTQLVPLLTLTLVGGAFADAFDRRRMLLVTEIAEAVAVAGLAVNAALPHPSIAVLFVLATVSAGCF